MESKAADRTFISVIPALESAVWDSTIELTVSTASNYNSVILIYKATILIHIHIYVFIDATQKCQSLVWTFIIL